MTPWVVLAFLALVVVLMCFSTSYRIAVIAGVIWLAILFRRLPAHSGEK